MEIIMMIAVVGLLVEAVVQTLRLVYDQATRKISIPIILSLVVGLIAAFGANLSIFDALPQTIAAPNWLGCALTGILVSRGSNFIHDLWNRINLSGSSKG